MTSAAPELPPDPAALAAAYGIEIPGPPPGR
jgi:hypothetical protein